VAVAVARRHADHPGDHQREGAGEHDGQGGAGQSVVGARLHFLEQDVQILTGEEVDEQHEHDAGDAPPHHPGEVGQAMQLVLGATRDGSRHAVSSAARAET